MNSSLVVALFIIGNLVGSGFFMLPTTLAQIGLNSMYSWAIAGTMALVFSMMFGRLYMLFPKSSVLSDYFENIITKKTIAMLYWISCIVGNAGVLIVIVASLNMVMNPLIAGLIIITILTLANGALNYDSVAKIEVLLTLVKFALLVFLPIGLYFYNPTIFQLPSLAGGKSEIASVGITAFWAFLGIETAGIFGSGKAAKRGLLLGVISCAILYMATSLFVIGCVSTEELNTGKVPFVLLLDKFLGPGYETYISSLIVFTAAGALYGWIAATSKMSLSYAKTKVFPKSFLQETKSKSSFLGLMISSALTWLIFASVSSMDISKQFSFIADLCVCMTLAIFALCAYALIKNAAGLKDTLIALFSMFCTALALLFNLKATTYSLITMVVTYLYIAMMQKKEAK